MAFKNFLVATWFFVFGLTILTHVVYPHPIETVIKASSLLNGTISCLKPYADCMAFAHGLGYVIIAVEILHGTYIGKLAAILISLASAATFDNPLFGNVSGRQKYVMIICHILMIAAVCSLCESSDCCFKSSCKKAVVTELPVKREEEEEVKKPVMEGERVKDGKKKKGGK